MNSWNLVLIECASLRGAPNCNIRVHRLIKLFTHLLLQRRVPSSLRRPAHPPSFRSHRRFRRSHRSHPDPMTAAPLKRCTSTLTLCYTPHLSHLLHLLEGEDGTIHPSTSTPIHRPTQDHSLIQREHSDERPRTIARSQSHDPEVEGDTSIAAHAPSNEATTIKRQVEPHLNNRDFISAPSHLEVPLHERNKKVPLLRRAQTSAEIQRATISENGGSDTETQNRVSAGNLSHLQLRLLSTTTRVTLHLRHDSRMFDAHLRLPLHPTETI